MASAETVTGAAEQLLELPARLEEHEGFREVVAGLKAGQAATLDGAWGSSCALAAAALAGHAPGPLVLVCARADDADDLADDLRLFTRHVPEVFPAWESMPGERQVQDETAGERIRLLKALAGADPPKLLLAGIQALMQPVPPPDSLARNTRRLRAGD